ESYAGAGSAAATERRLERNSGTPHRGRKPDPARTRLRLCAGHVLHVFVVFVAHVFDDLPVRVQLQRVAPAPRLGVGARIVDSEFVAQAVFGNARETLD